MPTRPKPRILLNAKDSPWAPSGYGNIVKHLTPRLAARYGADNIIIFGPVYGRDEVREYAGMRVLPGTTFDFGEDLVLDHYKRNDCTMLLQIGDWAQLRRIPELAAKDEILWVQWAPFDILHVPDFLRQILKFPLKIVPFSQYGERRLRELGLQNVHKTIWLGLDLEVWKPLDRAELPGLMDSVGFREDTYNVLICQANQRRKYLQETLQGIGAFRAAHPDAKVRVYMHTWMERGGEANLNQAVEEAGLADVTKATEGYKMVLGGFTEVQLAKLFNCADVVLDCAFEGFGLSMTQAQAVGVPVIGLVEGPMAELVKVGMMLPTDYIDYSLALHKPVASPAAIGQALGELYTQGVRKSEHPVAYIRDNFGWDQIASQWFEAIDEVMDMRERFTLYVPEPSARLRRKAREIVEL